MRILALFLPIIFFLLNFSQVQGEGISHSLLLECLHENSFVGAKNVDGRKLYLDEGALFLTSAGIIFCGENGDSAPIQCLHSDTNGCHVYLSSHEFEIVDQAWDGNVLNKCPGCGRRYFLVCKNPDCPLKRDRE